MLTVKEAVRMITVEGLKDNGIYIGFDGCAFPVLTDSTLFMDAYGDYLVGSIDVTEMGVQLSLLVCAQKATEQRQSA